jgi:hypothetical protein
VRGASSLEFHFGDVTLDGPFSGVAAFKNSRLTEAAADVSDDHETNVVPTAFNPRAGSARTSG